MSDKILDRYLSVLIVDDETIIRRGKRKLLDWEKLGFQVAGEAINGFDALEFLQKHQTDVILTDIKMPLMDGIALSKEISAKYPSSEIIIVTGYDEFSYAKEAVRAGVFDFLLKPVDPEELTGSLSRARQKILSRGINYPFKEEAEIKKAILDNDSEAAKTALNTVFDIFMQHKAPLETVRNIASKLVSEIFAAHKMYIGTEPVKPAPVFTNIGTAEQIRALTEEYLEDFFSLINSGSTDTLINSIISYIHSNYRHNITLATLENEFHFNASYISRIFKSRVGTNYNEYLINVRIEHAKQLLKNTGLSITEISDATGFGNSKYFSRVFKNCTGIQPIAYRNEYKKHEK